MKKLFPLLLTLLLISSCEDSIEVTTTTNINESASVTILETNGTAINFNEVIEGDLNQLVSNFNSINDITIDSLSYTFANVTGNENAVITSATIEINATTVAVISNINIAQEALNGSVFEITDTAVLDQLETIFLNNSSVTIQLSGMAISDEGDVNFDLEFSMQLTAAF
ncbi:hypothetical protein N9Q22_00810 [bacterium]|jgi:hypothetical protein|nr:hypothetical protein [Flavobacteriaceae bacterium]MDA9295189.1 hypothetical protein [bacterium]MDA9254027.1 hypothetical protein [Flavobacteriaceae bacterium]MDA9354059.1 hypothetical protein [Flavobacteriaceae bacterium]MDB4025042.1 hypothetical protein [Flavobacteriaceae bacterium]|tara:strand:- start:1278 stop:1784 length:507 start_codon:yes stop_codon:yes gene_type:complete